MDKVMGFCPGCGSNKFKVTSLGPHTYECIYCGNIVYYNLPLFYELDLGHIPIIDWEEAVNLRQDYDKAERKRIIRRRRAKIRQAKRSQAQKRKQ